ncbi:MAG TPA: TlpA disulfide reductase family protein [Candidatus Saccharimonadales bacterium]|nr:TlpA disulfide reductase family protein [Candidatus Saccharimonadales bacterium]
MIRSKHLSAAAAPLLLLLWPAAAVAQGTPGDQLIEKAPVEYFSQDIPLISGGQLSAEDLKGKILVIDVWGTWCGPCRRVIPHLIDLQNRFGSRGVMVIGISAEQGDSEEEAAKKVLRFASEVGINYKLGIFDADLYQKIRSLMRFEGDEFTVPSTFVVDRDGAVIARYPGYFYGQEKEIARLLEQKLGITDSRDVQRRPAGGDGPGSQR